MNKNNFIIETVENQMETIQFIEEMVYEFNASIIHKHDGELFTKVVRNKGEIIGGITGWTWAEISEITLLWVKESFRKNGLGKELLLAAENEIAKRGCSTIILRSYSFQAPLFYEKNGYKTLFVLEDFPKGFQYFNFVKQMS